MAKIVTKTLVVTVNTLVKNDSDAAPQVTAEELAAVEALVGDVFTSAVVEVEVLPDA